VVLKEQVADFVEVAPRTVENYLSQYEEELVRNGYEVIKGNRLKSFKSVLQGMDVPEIYFGNISKSPQLGILDFRAFLNLAMLMVESERARLPVGIETGKMSFFQGNGLYECCPVMVHEWISCRAATERILWIIVQPPTACRTADWPLHPCNHKGLPPPGFCRVCSRTSCAYGHVPRDPGHGR
jgi:hypothetical protein